MMELESHHTTQAQEPCQMGATSSCSKFRTMSYTARLLPDFLIYMSIIQSNVLSGAMNGTLTEKFFLLIQFWAISDRISFLVPTLFLKEIDVTAMSLW